MTKSRRISAQDWIQDYFSPSISVMASADAESLCQKNNLTLVEMLQPFSKLLTDITLKDHEGINHSVASLNITFQDFKKDPTRLVTQKLMQDLVAESSDEPMISRTFNEGKQSLEAPGYTPWFDIWSKLYMQSVPLLDHEFSRHNIGCVFAVSSGCPNAVEQLRNLNQQQHKHQHEKPNTYPQYFNPSILKYYLVVHDAYETDDARAQEMFTQVQTAFGSNFCHFLQINSRSGNKSSDESELGTTNPPPTAEFWFMQSHRFFNVESRLAGMGSAVVTPVPVPKVDTNNVDKTPPQPADHPLAFTEPKPDSPPPVPVSKLVPVTKQNIAQHLTPNDVDRIRIFVREFCIKGLIPHVEKQLRILHEVVSNRRGRSIFVGAKRWFGQSKGSAAAGTSVVYGKEAPELQVRKLGDLFFMLKLYKHAYNCYHTVKKDFQSDEAWNYYAGAAEMCALSQFMQQDATKKYPAHYMEDSITKYLQVCQMPEFAVRATLFDAMCLKAQGMFREAALSFIRMTNETKDARSSMLLEQASYCYLLSTPALVRKYAFYIILSGYRFSKCGQKKHASRTYRQGFQVYKGHGWNLSEDHILYTLGHQSLLLKDHYTAASLFNELLSLSTPNGNPLQQMCHLREFFIVQHMREKEDKQVAPITIPRFDAQKCVLSLEKNGPENVQWQELEKVILETVRGQDVVFLSRTCQQVFGPGTNNSLVPQGAIKEPVRFAIPVTNPFQTPLLLKKIHLLWKFTSNDGKEATNKLDDHGDVAKASAIESVTLEKGTTTEISLELLPKQPGHLTIHGVEYSIKALFPQSETTDYTIRGKQFFKLKGPRLKQTKEHKTSVCYGQDRRVEIAVLPGQPRLEASLAALESIHQGELRCVDLTLTNVGTVAIRNIHLVHHTPGLISFGRKSPSSKPLFDFPVIRHSSLKRTNHDGSVEQLDIDVLAVPTSGPIEPGQTAQVCMWVRGTAPTNGPAVFKFYFYYESAETEGKPSYRICELDFSTKIVPSVEVEAVKSNNCVFDNDCGHTVSVRVSNDTATATGDFTVEQIGLLSRSRVQLDRFLSKNESSTLPKQESTVINLRAVKTGTTTDDHRLCVSSVKMAGTTGHALHEPPFFDFLKNCFEFKPKERAELQDDFVVVFWKSGAVSGMHYAPLTEKKNDDDTDNGEGDKAIHEPLPCQVQVEMEPRFSNDFTRQPLFVAPFQLKVKNTSSSIVSFQYEADRYPGTVRLLGCTSGSVPIAPGKQVALSFRAVVSAPGLFHLRSLKFRLTEESAWIPLDIAFIVSQAG